MSIPNKQGCKCRGPGNAAGDCNGPSRMKKKPMPMPMPKQQKKRRSTTPG